MSGTWWVNSGADFTPDMAVPVPAGGYVKRTARTFHYDGVPHGMKEPVVIAIFGIGPVNIRLADPHLPAWRQVSFVCPQLADDPSTAPAPDERELIPPRSLAVPTETAQTAATKRDGPIAIIAQQVRIGGAVNYGRGR